MEITLQHVGKKYDASWIFRDVNSEFHSEGIYGIIGRNGSGKSTLLQILSGFVTPSEGSITFRNKKEALAIEDVYQYLSIATPYMDLADEFTVKETIELHAQFKPFYSGLNMEEILNRIQLDDHRNKTINHLSSGMRQRLKLALAIFSESSLLLVDEPCANLDSTWTSWFNQQINSFRKDRLIVICSNSVTAELECVNKTILDMSSFNS